MTQQELSLELIDDHLESILLLFVKGMQPLVTTENWPLNTDYIDFEIRNNGSVYYIVPYLMDRDKNQTGGGERLLPELKKTGIVLPASYALMPGSDDYSAEIFCEHNHKKIINLIAASLYKAWQLVDNKSLNIKGYVSVIDEDERFDLAQGMWMDI